MRTDILTLDPPMADDRYLPDLSRHPLSIDEVGAAGWGASWLPDAASRPAWLDFDDDLGAMEVPADPGALQPVRAAGP